jgi:hypothetical protein
MKPKSIWRDLDAEPGALLAKPGVSADYVTLKWKVEPHALRSVESHKGRRAFPHHPHEAGCCL